MRRALVKLLPIAAAAGFVVAIRLRRRWYAQIKCHVTVSSAAEAATFSSAIRHLILQCFPEDIDSEDARASLENNPLEVLSGFHDVDDCEWLLAFDHSAHLIGLAMTVPYHDSLYVASLCVLPEHQGRGVGSKLMRSASAHAAARGLPALSGSVRRSRHHDTQRATRLIDFYRSLEARSSRTTLSPRLTLRQWLSACVHLPERSARGEQHPFRLQRSLGCTARHFHPPRHPCHLISCWTSQPSCRRRSLRSLTRRRLHAQVRLASDCARSLPQRCSGNRAA